MHYNVALDSEYNQKKFIFYSLSPHVCFPFLRCFVVVLDISIYLGDKKVVTGRIRQVVVLYINDCMEICLGGLSIDRLGQVAVL